jgi:hypothetical protein
MDGFHNQPPKNESMVVANADIECRPISPAKNDTPLVVNANRIMPLKCSFEFLKTVARRNFQILNKSGCVNHGQLLGCIPVQFNGQNASCLARFNPLKDVFGSLVRKVSDHVEALMSYTTILDTDIGQRKHFALSKLPICLSLLALTTACVSRAPSENVMGSGTVFAPGLNASSSSGNSERPRLTVANRGSNSASNPRHTQPWVEKVWVYDQELAGQTYFQGTYVFVEVQPSQWSPAGEGRP